MLNGLGTRTSLNGCGTHNGDHKVPPRTGNCTEAFRHDGYGSTVIVGLYTRRNGPDAMHRARDNSLAFTIDEPGDSVYATGSCDMMRPDYSICPAAARVGPCVCRCVGHLSSLRWGYCTVQTNKAGRYFGKSQKPPD